MNASPFEGGTSLPLTSPSLWSIAANFLKLLKLQPLQRCLVGELDGRHHCMLGPSFQGLFAGFEVLQPLESLCK